MEGKYYPSIIAARNELDAMTGKRQREFSEALRDSTPYHGRILSHFPPGTKEVREGMYKRERGSALMRSLITHRLGV